MLHGLVILRTYGRLKVGYSLSERMTADLVCNALSMAIRNHKPSQGLIVHSDRGSQYCSHEYRNMLEKFGFKGSMSNHLRSILLML